MGKLTARALSVQLTIVILVSLILISAYSLVNTYNTHINSSQNYVKERLHAITNTAAACIKGEDHLYLTSKYGKKDALLKPEQDSVYLQLQSYFNEVKDKNNLESAIYTLFKHDKGVSFGVFSNADTCYWRHDYESHPEELKKHYESGATVGPYEDDNGVWLSSFAPIKTSDGKTVAVVQADVKFTTFLMEAREELMQNILWMLLIFIVITIIVLYMVRRLSKLDQEKNDELKAAYAELKITTRDLKDSINYAQRIQWALIPKINDLREHLPKSFMFYEPRDVVSGDFPWMFKKGKYVYVAAVDCTGHGVPGAMMSVIGHLLLNDIVNDVVDSTPGEILTQLHKSVVSTLKQDTPQGVSDGMDVAICRINLENNEVMYSGAHRPLYMLRDGKVQQFKGNSFPIGSNHYKKRGEFTDHEIRFKEKDEIYFFSDGLPDQFGANGDRKFGPKRIRKIIAEKDDFDNGEEIFRKAYLDWKGNYSQIDDILLIGIKF